MSDRDPITEDMKLVFGSEAGQRVLSYLMGQFHVFSPTGASSDLELAAAEGERNVVLHILSRMGHDMGIDEWLSHRRAAILQQTRRAGR